MSAAAEHWGERLADRVNPIVVKEVRQGLRARHFQIFFALLLVANLFLSLGFYAAGDTSGQTGKAAFLSFFVCLAVVQFFVIPYSAYRSMARESEDETWVLLTLTGLGPRRILLGKLGSYVVQGALYSSASAPFLLFSYYLNGIDLPTIVAAVVAGAAYQVFLVAVAVSLATQAETRLVRSFLHFVLLGVLLIGLGTGIGLAVAMSDLSRRTLASGDFWVLTGAWLYALLTTGVMLFETAAARLALLSEDYARGPRLAFLAQVAGLAGFFAWAALDTGRAGTLMGASLVVSAYAAIVGVIVLSDRDGMSPVLWAVSGRWSLLRPGALRGFVLVVASLGTATALLAWLALGAGLDGSKGAVLLAAPAFALVYLAGSHLVARLIPHAPHQTAAVVRLVFLALLVLGMALPPLVGELVTRADDPRLNVLNPVLGLEALGKDQPDASPALVVVWGTALAVTLGALVVLRRRDGGPPA